VTITTRTGSRGRVAAATLLAVLSVGLAVPSIGSASAREPVERAASASSVVGAEAAALAETRPNIVFFNLDDLRDAFPGAIDPLQFMPKTLAWMAGGTRYTQMFIADPSCCPSRAAMMTGRYPHNNGVLDQQDGPVFDGPHSMACYLRNAGYSTYMAGKFLISWPKTTTPPCFTNSTVMWGGYRNVAVKVNGVSRSTTGYSTTYLGNQGRQYITSALNGTAPFLLYETPHAPHWSEISNPDGTTSRYAIPDTPYANTAVGTCSGVPETDRSDKPRYVRYMSYTTSQAQTMCQSQLRAIMSVDDQFDATMRLLSDRGVLDNTLVILSSDNGFMWGEHGRWEKFVPYEPSIHVPLLVRWPGHVAAGTDTTRLVSSLDLLPTMLEAAGITLPTSPPLDGESLLQPSQRTVTYSEYYVDGANPLTPSWKMVRTPTAKYTQYYDTSWNVIAREYYNLTADPAENLNLLGDTNTSNNPPAATITALTQQLNAFATCAGAACVR
jgi:arylsulfatase A-like enzyme